ncbi:hypothetical protein Pla163_37860 [Planctomycetes bacterium Pla163]|uniref:DUF4177 domain-containing protein n=1 Tax=Rohdeia mirabilis TaxID=2528008 RepID=A0A518D583_9BACT|nr:hypothetical protein Pla163_37860 [Planctomycetes bacterium Pla163]
MTDYTYKVVPFLGSLANRGKIGEVSKQLESLINEGARNGWEFHSVTTVALEVKPGCLGALLSQGPTYVRHDQVVFRRRLAT